MTALGYAFSDTALLRRALTHRSHLNECGQENTGHNERLEFLGDAVIDLAVGRYLMYALPDAREGQLSKLRAMVVSEASLASAARRIGLGQELRLGHGEERTGGRDKASILADALEATIGAIFVDSSYEVAQRVVDHLLGPLAEAAVHGRIDHDHKTRLQELAQAQLRQLPRYQVIDERGPDHAKIFEVAVRIENRELARAKGHSKKEAEQRAARLALQTLT